MEIIKSIGKNMKIKVSTLVILFAFGMLSLNAQPTEIFADNGVIKVKLDLTRGGAINYLSNSGTSRNLVNIHDEGRYIQQSYYAGNNLNRIDDGQASNWSPWPWNPIQVGDAFGNRSEILDYKQNDDTLYVKCIPMLWDMNNKPAEAEMEQWIILKDNILEVHNRLTCFRTDSLYGENILRDQELPAVYPISALENLYYYSGIEPFTNDTLSNPPVVNLSSGFWGRYFGVSEHWMAFVDDDMKGIGVYNPICNYFIAGRAGEPGYEALDGSTSYIAPVKKEALSKNSVYDYTYFLIVGSVDEIRTKVYELSVGFEEPAQKTGWNFDEENNFEDWQLNGALEGVVSNGYLQMNVIAGDPFMTNMDGMMIDASKFDKIQIKMKNNTPDTIADIFFKNAQKPEQYNMIRFETIPTDSIYREYQIILTENPEWSGSIVMLRLDPVASVSTGSVSIDHIRLVSNVSSAKSEDLPKQFQLSQNYPNPFNPSTVIDYKIAEAGIVELTVFNILGERIQTLLKKYQSAGSYEAAFNAEDISSGIYLYKLTAGNNTQFRKMIFMK